MSDPNTDDDKTARAIVSSHLNARGEAHMVDVSSKVATQRRASARAIVRMKAETVASLRRGAPKGDVLSAARIAGIMAAKRTPELIPLCHSVALTRVIVDLDVLDDDTGIRVTAAAEALDRTGVEMEALTAVTIASLTIYDMLKGIDREMVISEVVLLEKSGGRTGTFRRSGSA